MTPVYSQPSAKIVLDSISVPAGVRLTTAEIKIHRFALAEFNTHRVFSRNSASSRAIPINKQIEKAMVDPALPLYWGKNQPGMQAREELSEKDKARAIEMWLEARDESVHCASKLSLLGLHKQLTNRLLEPWLWQTIIVSSTEWENFFDQRCHADALPEFKAAADSLREALAASTPIERIPGDWHMPYISAEELLTYDSTSAVMRHVSVARCARVSYLTHDGIRSIEADLELYDRLVSQRPPHASPLEHVATPATKHYPAKGNFKGWAQLRHIVLRESQGASV